ncbi:MAG TPA: (d)CMP kinase [Gemmatimonadales bacterium]|nr:(d)CMP kinase [Gemmatimonadales bacterium]
MSSTRRKPIVAIDGPAASGKSTTARAVARALGFRHIDSGALYRAMTVIALDLSDRPERWRAEDLVGRARVLGLALGPAGGDGPAEVLLGGAAVGQRLRSDSVTREVSRVAAMPEVREFVNALIRAAVPDGGAVLDGRDIGTAVFPDAEVKVFLVADPAERARRRLAERGTAADARSVRSEADALTGRDVKDASRRVAPLARAADAVELDTTALSFDEQVRTVLELVRRHGASLDREGGAG